MPVVPDQKKIRAFKDEASFEKWLALHHDREAELWLKIHKKGSQLPTVTYAQALDVALCWGWIDGLKKSYDEASFLQRFTPRRPKSLWSQINREHVARLIKVGRMTEYGLRHVEAAKRDGRWEAAYASPRHMQLPEDFRHAIMSNRRAGKNLAALGKQEQYFIAFRIHNTKTAATRAKKIAAFVALLAAGQSPLPPSTQSQ